MIRDATGKSHGMGDRTRGRPSFRKAEMTSKTSAVISGSKAEVWLVHEEEGGVYCQSPGNGNTLPLSTAHLGRTFSHVISQTEPGERGFGPLLGVREMMYLLERKHDVLQGGEGGKRL